MKGNITSLLPQIHFSLPCFSISVPAFQQVRSISSFTPEHRYSVKEGKNKSRISWFNTNHQEKRTASSSVLKRQDIYWCFDRDLGVERMGKKQRSRMKLTVSEWRKRISNAVQRCSSSMWTEEHEHDKKRWRTKTQSDWVMSLTQIVHWWPCVLHQQELLKHCKPTGLTSPVYLQNWTWRRTVVELVNSFISYRVNWLIISSDVRVAPTWRAINEQKLSSHNTTLAKGLRRNRERRSQI